MIKDVLVNLSVDSARDVAAEYAISVAQAFDAVLTGVAFAYEPVIPGTVFGSIPPEIIEAGRAESDKAAHSAREKFDEAARRAGISANSQVMDGTLVGGADLFGRMARRFDISIACQPEPGQSSAEELLIEQALFGSGRPALVVPYIQRDGLKLDRALVCWDGGRTAARAVGDAMPFLKRAKNVEVVIVTSDPPKSDELPGALIGEHLARHGLKVEVKNIVAPQIDVANAILSHAADFAADFLVMGGYGHSRLREFILGGATRGILQAMTVPTLMAH
jgi:nucleotide-binding universal stress UspA family protein